MYIVHVFYVMMCILPHGDFRIIVLHEGEFEQVASIFRAAVSELLTSEQVVPKLRPSCFYGITGRGSRGTMPEGVAGR